MGAGLCYRQARRRKGGKPMRFSECLSEALQSTHSLHNIVSVGFFLVPQT